MHPTPYTAEQIRDAMPAGTTVRFRAEKAGEPTTQQLWEVTGNPAEGLLFSTSTLADDGVTVLEPAKANGPVPWEALRRHAEFSKADTTRTAGEVTVPIGTFAGILFVRTKPGDPPTVTTLHFANDIPGPPVLMTVDVGGERVMTQTMVARTGFDSE